MSRSKLLSYARPVLLVPFLFVPLFAGCDSGGAVEDSSSASELEQYLQDNPEINDADDSEADEELG